jgi:tetratricopeptide (TPR) repeat protein
MLFKIKTNVKMLKPQNETAIQEAIDTVALAKSICQKEPVRANTLIEQVCSQFPSLPIETKAEALFAKGIANKVLGKWKSSEEALTEAKRLYEQIGRSDMVAKLLNALATLYMEQGNYTKVMEYFQQSLAVWVETNNLEGIATVSNNLGNVFYYMADYMRALEHYQKAFKIRKSIGKHSENRNTLNNLGVVYMAMRDYENAVQMFEKCLKFKSVSEGLENESIAMLNLAEASRNLGKMKESENAFETARSLCERLGQKVGVARALRGQGLILEMQNRLREAITLFQQSLEMFEQTETKRDIALTYYTLGKAYSKLQQENSNAISPRTPSMD